MWEQQLLAMVEANHFDQDTIRDLGVVYAAETGDGSLIRSFMISSSLPLRNVIRNGSVSMSNRAVRYSSKSSSRVLSTTCSRSKGMLLSSSTSGSQANSSAPRACSWSGSAVAVWITSGFTIW